MGYASLYDEKNKQRFSSQRVLKSARLTTTEMLSAAPDAPHDNNDDDDDADDDVADDDADDADDDVADDDVDDADVSLSLSLCPSPLIFFLVFWG